MNKIGFVSKKESDAPAAGKEELIEITARIREDQLFALDLIESAELASAGKSDRDETIREALDMLINDRIKAVDLREKKFLKTGDE